MSELFPDGLARNFVAGQWREGDGGASIAVEDPATGKTIMDCAKANEASLSLALTAARDCFERGDMSAMVPEQRGNLMRRIAMEIRKLADEGSRWLCHESGKRLIDAKDEFDEAARYFDYYGGFADKIEGRSIPLGADYIDFTVHEPFGVSAQVIPWNFPVSLAARSMAPAMAAGNSVIVKSPELDPLALSLLGTACQRAEVPDGAVSILNGIGSDLGQKLAASPQIDQIVFTGSVATGQAILHAAADHITPALVELGGKSAGIAFADCDADQLMDSVKQGIFSNAGQVCSAMSRLLVERSRYDEIVERTVALAESLTIGHGMDNPDHTPVISAPQLARMEAMVSTAQQDGARVATGGSRMDRSGHFMSPTILAGVEPKAVISQQEIFGPVLCIIPFDSDAEAVEIANNTEFGLVGGVFTHDLNRAHRTAQKLRCGQVFVNQWFAGGIQTPFGGVGKSGFGREKGLEAVFNYVRTKNVAIRLQ